MQKKEAKKEMYNYYVQRAYKRGYLIEATLHAQKFYIFFTKLLLRDYIKRELRTSTTPTWLVEIFNQISERKLIDLLKKFELVDKPTYNSLMRFNEMRNDFTHTFMYSLDPCCYDLENYKKYDFPKLFDEMSDNFDKLMAKIDEVRKSKISTRSENSRVTFKL